MYTDMYALVKTFAALSGRTLCVDEVAHCVGGRRLQTAVHAVAT